MSYQIERLDIGIRVTRPVIAPLLSQMSEEEKASIGTQLAELADQETEHNDKKAAFMKEWKQQNEELKKRFNAKLTSARTGLEVRQVQCVEVFDHTDGTHYFEHENKRHGLRQMESEEYQIGQGSLFQTDDEGEKIAISRKVKKLRFTEA